jgi:hypothetical protein
LEIKEKKKKKNPSATKNKSSMGKLVSIIGNCFPGHKLLHSIHPWFCKGIDHEICFLKGVTEENITQNRRKPRGFNG